MSGDRVRIRHHAHWAQGGPVWVVTDGGAYETEWDSWPEALNAANDLLAWNCALADAANDLVNHPAHYTSDPSGIECIQITRHRNFNVGNAIKYLWRAGLKQSAGKDALSKQIEDLRKSIFYIQDEIARLECAES